MGSGTGTAELGQGEGLTKSQLGLPLFLIRVTQLGILNWLSVDQQNSVGGPNCVGWGRNSLVGDRFCRLGTQPEKNVFPSKMERFSRGFFPFSALGAPFHGVRTANTSVSSGPKWAKDAEKEDFPSLGGRSGRNTWRLNLIAR